MITKPQPSSRRYLRKLLVLPLAVLLLGLVAFRYKPGLVIINIRPTETITVIVDAGHGGELDPGVKSPDNKYQEASLTLELANTMQRLAPEYGIKVVLTRETNEAIGATKQADLRKRVEMIKEIAPAAFLSLHINSTGRNEYQQQHSGFEAYISSKRTDESGQLLASAILGKLSDVYKTKMQIKQRKAESIYMLDHNSCPSVMLECGYINNQQDLAFVTNKDNQEKIARVILSALRDHSKP